MTGLRRFVRSIEIATAIVAGVALFEPSARADEALDACGAAAVSGQKFRRSGKLREAQTWFEVCQRSTCREDIRKDCVTWWQEIERSLPSISVEARDAQGNAVTDARVLVDGTPMSREALAAPIPLEPGTHTLELERHGMNPISRTVVLREGDKAQVSVIFEASRAPAQATAPTPPATHRPVPASVYVSSAIAAAGITAFGVMGGLGYADWRDSKCDVQCPTSDADRVSTTLLVADISLAVFVVAGGIATWLYLTRPTQTRSQPENTAFVRRLELRW